MSLSLVWLVCCLLVLCRRSLVVVVVVCGSLFGCVVAVVVVCGRAMALELHAGPDFPDFLIAKR